MKDHYELIGLCRINNHVLIVVEADDTCIRCALNVNNDNGTYGVECSELSELGCMQSLDKLITLKYINDDFDMSLISVRPLINSSHYLIKLINKLNMEYETKQRNTTK